MSDAPAPNDKALPGTLNAFARIARDWLTASDRGTARLLIAGVVALTFLQVGIQIRFNLWNRDFFNALENRDNPEFMLQMAVFLGLAALSMAASVYQLYLKQLVQLRWREWLSGRLIAGWLRDGRHYQLEITGGAVQNPDQRVAEDARIATELAVDFTLGLLISLTTLMAFVGILWTLSGALRFSLFGTLVAVPGYMVWAALLYALLGSGLTWVVGRPMVDINIRRAGSEAEFRFGLVRARENGEAIALIHGETDERRVLAGLFVRVRETVAELMRSQRHLMWLTSAYGSLAMVFPTLVASPAYFAGAITLGGLMQIGAAFGQVQGSLNWFVDNFPNIAEWRSAVARLLAFRAAIDDLDAMQADPAQPTIRVIEACEGDGPHVLAFRDVQVAFSDGTTVIAGASAEIHPGEHVLIKGESGTGKSTLFRAIAGLWPWGAGEILVPPRASLMFMPQRPYIPNGSLLGALSYPAGPGAYGAEAAAATLAAVGLNHLVARLADEERWDRILSLGEQQRLAFARLLLQRPGWIFMDEATAALDEENQDAMMRLVQAALPESAIISIGHRPGLEAFHDRSLTLIKGSAGARLMLPERKRRPRPGWAIKRWQKVGGG